MKVLVKFNRADEADRIISNVDDIEFTGIRVIIKCQYNAHPNGRGTRVRSSYPANRIKKIIVEPLGDCD